jgi:SOS-response transcriptional repressor LexA
MENLKINHRIVEFIAHTKLSDTEFALKLGYKSVSEISRIRNDNDVPDIFIRRMKLAYPDLNIDWIYHGHLPMMMNEMHEAPLTYRSIKNINQDPHGKEIPVINTEVYASIVSVLSASITLPPDTFIRIPIFSEGEAAVLVRGHSMKGYINQGDWVVIKRLMDRHSIMYGEAHLIVTKGDNLQTVKFIKPADEDDQLTLVPYNIEQFEPQNIYKDDILAIYRVVGSFRSH